MCPFTWLKACIFTWLGCEAQAGLGTVAHVCRPMVLCCNPRCCTCWASNHSCLLRVANTNANGPSSLLLSLPLSSSPAQQFAYALVLTMQNLHHQLLIFSFPIAGLWELLMDFLPSLCWVVHRQEPSKGTSLNFLSRHLGGYPHQQYPFPSLSPTGFCLSSVTASLRLPSSSPFPCLPDACACPSDKGLLGILGFVALPQAPSWQCFPDL